MRRDRDRFAGDMEDMNDVAQRRLEETERLNADCKRLTQELAQANAAKCDILVRTEDIGKRKLELYFFLWKKYPRIIEVVSFFVQNIFTKKDNVEKYIFGFLFQRPKKLA